MANIGLGARDGSRLTEGRRIRFSAGLGLRLTAVKIEERGTMRLRVFALLGVTTVALALAVPAFGFDCTVAKKPPTAGAVGIVDVEDNFTPLKPNPGTEEQAHGGFIAFTDGTFTTSTFLHAPDGVLPPVRSGGPQDNCDGKGLDSLEECFAG
jgi:hypothetical protein